MRIDSIQIEGFGIFTGIVLDALPARFILLHGENGAGKSTLLDFIRSVLFGPEQGAGARKYPPLRGAAHRGDLIVETSAGDRYRVQRGFTDRGPGRVDVLPVPPTSRVVDLATILGSTTRRLYTRVFGFSLDELQDTQSLSDGEIAARFYSIGGGVGSRCQADIAVRLSQDLSSLFKPRGRDPKINAAIRQIDDTQKRLKEAAGGIVAYRHCSEERRVIDARLDGQRTQLQELQRDLDRANLCSSAWDTWVQLGIHRRTLAALPVLETFPDSGLARLENADADRSRCHQMCDDLEAQRTALLAKKSSVHRDAQILSHSSAIEACWAESNRYRDVLEEHPRRTLELEGSRRDLNGALQRLGPGWDLARVQRFDTGLAMLATVQQFRDTITSLRRAREEAEVLAENAAGQAAEAEAALDRDRRAIASRWSPTPAETSVLDERTRNIRRTRDLLRIKAELQRDLTTAEAANTEAQQNRERMQRALDSIPTSTGMPILWTVPAAALLAGGCFYRTPPVLIAFGFLAAVASIVSWIVRRRIDPRAALDRAAAGSDLAEAVQKVELCSERLSSIRNQEAECETDLKSIINEQGFGISPADLISAEAALDQAIRRRHEYEQEYSRVEKQKDSAADLQEKYLRRQTTMVACRREEEEKLALWHAWLVERSLPVELRPEDVDRLRESLDHILSEHNRLEDLERAADIANSLIHGYETAVRELSAACSLDPEIETSQTVSELWTRLAAERTKVMESEQIDRDLDILVRQAEAAARRYQEAREVFDHLIEQGQSANADEFRSNAFLWDKRQELIQQITMDENRLEATSGPGNARISLEAELEDSSREALTDRIRSLEERCSVATNERDRLQRRLGELDQELRGLTDDRQIEQLLEDQAEHQTELEALAADWALLKTTAWLLERTRKQYERERQPAVLRAASEQLRAITGGAYERVVQPLEATENRGRNGETLLLTSRDGRRKGLATWNRGLREQVYLSLRLGYIETYSSANEPLPIIMDDILVNCDPAHTNRSARQILNLAKNHQVLYLTCHPETIEMFRVLDPAIACFQIDNGTILRTQ